MSTILLSKNLVIIISRKNSSVLCLLVYNKTNILPAVFNHYLCNLFITRKQTEYVYHISLGTLRNFIILRCARSVLFEKIAQERPIINKPLVIHEFNITTIYTPPIITLVRSNNIDNNLDCIECPSFD